ncbi:MAG: hypothetical protein NZ937_09715, partial [Armatimonadetes bacterium]|nr:hypothetical protein [Armatimonadota bacterium]
YSASGAIRYWFIYHIERLTGLSLHQKLKNELPAWAMTLAFSQNGQLLVAGLTNGNLQLWRVLKLK